MCVEFMKNFSLSYYLSIFRRWLNLNYLFMKQECIPVGCVPATRRPYGAVCSGGGVSGPGGGVWSGGGGLLPGGVSQHALRQTPSPVKIVPWPNFVAAGNNGCALITLPYSDCEGIGHGIGIAHIWLWWVGKVWTLLHNMIQPNRKGAE